MTTQRKTRHVLPDEVREIFEDFAEKRDTESRDRLIRSLRSRGWTLQSISTASALTRERVRQISATQIAPGDEWKGWTPSPPVKEAPKPREYVEPDPDVLRRLLELQGAAQSVRANSPDHRAEAEEYTRLIWDQHDQGGVTLYRLAKRLGVTHGALRFRLARYGYKQPADGGTSKVYAPIKSANRVQV